MESLTWLGIAALVLQSGMFSGLNLAFFGISALNLKTRAQMGDEKAVRVLRLREDSNFLLTTILWGNVGTNVLLTMLSDSVMAGAAAFVFSTFVITFGGEIIPQAYFSRNALRMASLLSPMLRLYQLLLYPVAKPSALVLDAWLGKEGVDYIPEEHIIEALRLHVRAPESDLGDVEGTGAINFMKLDDVLAEREGEALDPASVIRLQQRDGQPVFPGFQPTPADPFLRRVQASGRRWVFIATDDDGPPVLALDASEFLRAVLFDSGPLDPLAYCHPPVTVADRHVDLAQVIGRLEVQPGKDVIHDDVIVVWGDEKRVITGADLFGYLMRGIARGSVAT